jgi:hypothetical protein
MKLWRGLTKWVAGLAFAAGATVSSASLITFTYTGVIDNSPGVLSGLVPSGSVVSGVYSFQDNAPDSAADPNTGLYFNAGSSFVANLGGTTFASSPVNISITNLPTVDIYRVEGGNLTGPAIGGYRPAFMSFTLTDNASATALSSDALLLQPPSIAAFNVNQFTMVFLPTTAAVGTSPLNLVGRITNITNATVNQNVPIPGIAGLLLLGLVGLSAKKFSKLARKIA